jgi:hypothetical protein
MQVITTYDYFVITNLTKFIDGITQKCEIYFNKLPGNNANPTQTRQVRRLQNANVKLAKMQLTECTAILYCNHYFGDFVVRLTN